MLVEGVEVFFIPKNSIIYWILQQTFLNIISNHTVCSLFLKVALFMQKFKICQLKKKQRNL